MENSNSNSRRRTRLETCQSASANAMGASVACEIRNYCRLGLYLLFTETREAQAAHHAWRKGMPVEVVFAATVQGQPQLLRIKGTVAHVSAAGAGLAVPAMSQEALQALQAASTAAAVQPAPAAVAGLDGPGEPRPALEAQCTALFESALRRVFGELFGSLDDRFAQAHDKSTDATERKWLRDAPAAIRFGRTRIEKAFFTSAYAYVQQLRQENTDASVEAPASHKADELSLLEEPEFEDWLNLAAVVNGLESDGAYGPTLVLVERRYAQFTGRPLDSRHNPFGPAMVGHYLQQALRDPILNNCTRAVLYRAFGPLLQKALPALAEQLAQALSAFDEPQLGRKPERADNSRSASLSNVEVLDSADAGQGSEAALPEEPLHRSLLAVARSLLRAADVGQGAAGSLGPAFAAIGADLGTASGSTAGPAAGLADLAHLIDGVSQAGWRGLRGALQTPFSAQLSNAGGGLHIPHLTQNALDSVATLLVRAQGVSGGGAAIDSLLTRLEAPLLKLALREHSFLDNVEHPARQVVDLLEQFAIAVDDDGHFLDAKLQRYLHKAVEHVLQQAEHDPEVFARTRDSMARVLEPLRQTRNTRLSRVLESCESRHRFRQARQRVDRALDARLGGLQVPQIVLSLLEAGWRQALVLLEFRVGEEAEQWRRELEMVDELVALLSPDSEGSTFERRRAALAASGHIEALLASVNSDIEQRDALIADLQRALEGVFSEHAAPQSAPYLAPSITVVGEPGVPELHSQATPPALRVGDWWFVLKEKLWLPMQLIWTSSTVQDCALTNRSATRHLELTLQEFHNRLHEGSIKAWSDQALPLVERSVQAMLDEGRAQVLQRSLRDPLTGRLNRKGFVQRLTQATSSRESEHTHLLAIVEFDQFRVVSQACGLAQGDALARALADEVQAALGQHDMLGSFREDVMAVYIPNVLRADGLSQLNAMLDKLSDYRFQTGGQAFSIGVNIGVAEFVPGLQDPDTAVQQADMACVAAKVRGRNHLQCYEADSRQLKSQQDLVDWAGRIDSLLNDSLPGERAQSERVQSGAGLYLRGQKVMPIAANSGLHAYHEVLLGIELEAGRSLGPMPFVMAVEGLRRAHELDLWVLHKVFGWIRNNPAAFVALGGFSINLSAMSLANADIIDTLRGYLLADDIPAQRISFEITESAAIQSYGAAADFIRQMRRFGCKFALDDFGSGHTSYAHLKNLHADVLKIDGSFVKDIVDNPADYAIVKSMNDIAHSLGMHTVAEYVESPAILAKLREIGVDYAQGYAIHKPARIEQLLVVSEAPRRQPDREPTGRPLMDSAVAVA